MTFTNYFRSSPAGASAPEALRSDAPRAKTLPDTSLSTIAVGTLVRVTALALEDDLRAWLRAVGIGEGDRLVVLRRAAFGGPIHVRTQSGGEFALNLSLARTIVVEKDLHPKGASDDEESAA